MSSFSSFDDVAKRYSEIKPIRGRTEDVRPIAERRYTHNRIIKLSDNKYALNDGFWGYWENNTVTEQTTPILWERRDDGDYMTVRSHKQGSMSISRYQFIDAYLPAGMSFSWGRSGKHFVHDHKKVLQYYLPKFKADFDYTNRMMVMEEDNKLVFKYTPEGMVRVGELVPEKTRRLDKELDKEYHGKLTAMYEWMRIVLPILGDTFKSSRSEYADIFGSSYWYWQSGISPKEVREILEDIEHPKRMAFAALLAWDSDAIEGERFHDKPDTYKRMRNIVRRVGDFYKVEMV
jgi:hypothetical protein